jgi:hypothetical protein
MPDRTPLCPSAQADWPDGVVFGIVGGTVEDPWVEHLAETLPVDDELLVLTEPVTPAEVLRIAAPCLCSGCVHFEANTCQLARRVVESLPAVVETLPRCSIRPKCRWWLQEGPAACNRCPQIVTDNYSASEDMRAAAYGDR